MKSDRYNIDNFLKHYVAIDLEIHPENNRILKIGAIAPDRENHLGFKGKFNAKLGMEKLDAFCKGAKFILGHNISSYDIPWLKQNFPELRLLSYPLIDTLYLSPLAFPRNPYHRLVKDYKIVRETVNDPVADSNLTISLFYDQIDAFSKMKKESAGIYGVLLNRSYPDDGYDGLFRSLTKEDLPDLDTMRKNLLDFTKGKVCEERASDVFNRAEIDSSSAVYLAYIFAWLQVAGENSVLPPWVRHRFPNIPEMLDTLRSRPCLRNSCSYCNAFHDTKKSLKQYFGFNEFLPVKNEFPPLQQQVVDEIIRGNCCLAVLPTGAGKSLCYQLPGLMKSRQRNQLTLIISPLQSLMKDQVDGLKAKGVINVGTVNGMLTMLERRQTLDGVVKGDIDLLWLAPEQLRNSTVKSSIRQREVGMVVIDEAHCFSKWGHDFRPDYLYITRFITELCAEENRRLPQITCFTATAKKDVIEEIKAYFNTELKLAINVFEGGHERVNLSYQVEYVAENEKQEIIHKILAETFEATDGDGGGIVFATYKKTTEEISEKLEENGWAVDYFHGERTPDEKKQIQERFLNGDLQVIVATNAFGMGVDKPDVRVVIHADIPGSIENYLQEAGRAGRDRKPASCILLFNSEDLEKQFMLGSSSRLEWGDVSSMFTGLKKLAAKHPESTVVLTSGELLSSDAFEDSKLADLSVEEFNYDTKVKTAIAWLEKSGKLLRGDNKTQYVEGRILVENIEEAVAQIDKLGLSQTVRKIWMRLLMVLFQCEPKELINTDKLSHMTGIEPEILIATMRSMREAGIINHDMNMTAYVHKGIADDTIKRFNKYLEIEKAVMALMAETDPDAGPDKPVILRLRKMSQVLKDREMADARPDRILMVLEIMIMARLIRIYQIGSDTYKLFFQKEREFIDRTVNDRTQVGHVILDFLVSSIPSHIKGKDILVEFRSGELHQALKNDIATRYLNKLEDLIKSSLLALHKINAISLQSGLAVYRPAMTIQVTADKDEKFKKSEFLQIEQFQKEKIIQVHIVGRYAELAMETIKKALSFVSEYFFTDRNIFLKTFFSGQLKFLELPTTIQTYRGIVTDLKNPIQENAVTSSRFKNRLIVAGPGSGKTRVITHRIAYLIRVQRVRPKHILAVAFNRSAVTQLKQRLKDLIGKEGSWVRVRTYHSLAMAITGRSFAGKSQVKKKTDIFDNILNEAVEILEKESEADHGILGWRNAILSGLKYIMVDEYQDINDIEYRFLSLLAGRNEKETGRRPCLLAVGDDDQNIYSWQGANVKFIRNFQKDYNAELIYMTGNYRSTGAIIEASNCLISKNKDRMKRDAIVRAGTSAVKQENIDKVKIIKAPDEVAILKSTLVLANDLLKNDKSLSPGDICILCRTNNELDSIQIMARKVGVPVKGLRSRPLPIIQTREFQVLIKTLNHCGDVIVGGNQLRTMIEGLIEDSGFSKNNIWTEIFKTLFENYLTELGESKLPIGNFIDYLYDSTRDIRQTYQTGKDKIFISTMHTAKGLEFPTVFIVGQPSVKTGNIEDERRLYYVAMTRAMKRLYCLYHEKNIHQFIEDLKSCDEKYIEHESIYPKIDQDDINAVNSILWNLELQDVVISFPAYKNVYKKVQQRLSNMEPGNSRELSINKIGKHYNVCYKKHPVARLSNKGSEEFNQRISEGYKIDKIIFLASIKRTKDSENDTVNDYAVLNTWYTGLFQIIMIK